MEAASTNSLSAQSNLAPVLAGSRHSRTSSQVTSTPTAKQLPKNPIERAMVTSATESGMEVAETCQSLLLNEMVQCIRWTTSQREKRERRVVRCLLKGKEWTGTDHEQESSSESEDDETLHRDFDQTLQSAFPSPAAETKRQDSNTMMVRMDHHQQLERLGFRVGFSLTEKLAKERPRFQAGQELEVMKFICKDLWHFLFKKQMDNLKTNHRGTFVLQDNAFKWLDSVTVLSSSTATTASTSQTTLSQDEDLLAYTAFPCGLLRGALANLGLQSVVQADVHALPQCTFKLELSNMLEGGRTSAASGR